MDAWYNSAKAMAVSLLSNQSRIVSASRLDLLSSTVATFYQHVVYPLCHSLCAECYPQHQDHRSWSLPASSGNEESSSWAYWRFVFGALPRPIWKHSVGPGRCRCCSPSCKWSLHPAFILSVSNESPRVFGSRTSPPEETAHMRSPSILPSIGSRRRSTGTLKISPTAVPKLDTTAKPH